MSERAALNRKTALVSRSTSVLLVSVLVVVVDWSFVVGRVNGGASVITGGFVPGAPSRWQERALHCSSVIWASWTRLSPLSIGSSLRSSGGALGSKPVLLSPLLSELDRPKSVSSLRSIDGALVLKPPPLSELGRPKLGSSLRSIDGAEGSKPLKSPPPKSPPPKSSWPLGSVREVGLPLV